MKRPPTAKQIAANRANAQKSTGPRTPEGKAESSRNALRHGVYSEKVLLEGEAEGMFRELRERMMGDLRPDGLAETTLAEQLVLALWRVQRVVRAEERMWAAAALEAARTGGRLRPDLELLEKLGEVETRWSRKWHAALKRLGRLQEEREKREDNEEGGMKKEEPRGAVEHKIPIRTQIVSDEAGGRSEPRIADPEPGRVAESGKRSEPIGGSPAGNGFLSTDA